MSQEKVDRYKQQKAKVKENIKKEKRNRVFRWTAAIVIFAAAVSWFGYSVYQSGKPSNITTIETDYTAFDTYINGLGVVEE